MKGNFKTRGFTRFPKKLTLSAGLAVSMLALGTTVDAKGKGKGKGNPNSGPADIGVMVDASCDVLVTSSKNVSNIVIGYSDGSTKKIDDIEDDETLNSVYTLSYDDYVPAAGNMVTSINVKAGNNGRGGNKGKNAIGEPMGDYMFFYALNLCLVEPPACDYEEVAIELIASLALDIVQVDVSSIMTVVEEGQCFVEYKYTDFEVIEGEVIEEEVDIENTYILDPSSGVEGSPAFIPENILCLCNEAAVSNSN